MSRATEWTLDAATHNRIYSEEVLPESGFHRTTPQEHPRAIVLAGQPGAGKGGLAEAAKGELAGNVVTLDLDEKRRFHKYYEHLRETHPYTWASHTHQDARGWTDKLNHAFVEGRRNIVFDTTLGGADHWIGEMKKMQALSTHPYEVEVRVLATHRLESEHGVHERFTDGLDKDGHGRFVPKEVRSSVYDNLPANLDKVHAQLPDARIRIYNREGAELYDSRTSSLKPGAALAQAREARLTDPERTRGLNNKWRAQQAWEQQLPESLQRNPKVTPPTAQNVLRENSELKIKTDVQRAATEATAIDRAVRIEPGIARVHLGLKVAGAAAQVPDAIATGREASRLLDQGNLTGAQSQVMHFAGRSLGMAGGAMAVGAMAAAAGIETGPGAVVAGLAGGVIGAVAGDRIMDAADQARIHSQRGSDGNVWKLDPQHPEQGWTRLPRPGEFGPQGPSEAAGYKSHLMHAAPRLADELNYKASSKAVELALARGPALQDPFRQPAESTGEAVRPGLAGANQPWTRDPQSHAWTRQTLAPATPQTHGMPVQRTVTASPEQALQLERAAQATIAANIAQGPQATAARYQSAYDQAGWKQHGPVPEAVRKAAQTPPGQLPASDGHTYTRGQDGQWTTPGSVYGTNTAQGAVRAELEATLRQAQALQPTPMPAAVRAPAQPEPIPKISTHEQRITPTPGGISFAEAHKRRDEPEQISAGSLQPVGRLDASKLVKGSLSYRMHQANEQDLMRSLGVAQAQDRERFKNEPNPQRPLLDRTHERQLDRAPVQKQPALSAPEVKAPAPLRGEQTMAPAIHAPAPGHDPARSLSSPTHAIELRAATAPTPSPPMADSAAAAVAAAQAQAAAAQAEMAEMRQQMARMTEQRRQGELERRDQPDQRAQSETTQFVQGNDARQPLRFAPGVDDPRHARNPHHALFNQLKERIPEASERRLLEFTAACHANRITDEGLGRIHFDRQGGHMIFTSSWPPCAPAVVDLKNPSPEPSESIQAIQQTEQQRTQRSELRMQQAAQANQQQGPALG